MRKTSKALPALRRKIRSNFLGIIALYAIFGFIMILGVVKESDLTPKLLHMNYDSIAAASAMKEAWSALRYPESAQEQPRQRWIDQFQKAIAFQIGNCTEPGEKEATQAVKATWDRFAKGVSVSEPESEQMKALLSRIVSMNEAGMFRFVGQSSGIARRVSLIALGFFLLSLVIFILWSDNLALRLARPLKDIAETLRVKPALGNKLRLPEADSLEMSILILELRGLWDRLGELSRLNLEELSAQRIKLATVLSCVDDAILVLDNEDRIIHCNPGMAKLMNLNVNEIRGNKWSDLPLVNDTYLTLREQLKAHLSEEKNIEINEGASPPRFYSVRGRPIETEARNVIGTVYLLHDITEKRNRDRLKSEFIGVLSHELKTPLQSLSTATEIMLKKKEELDEDGKMLMETIADDIARIRGVANDFMQLGLMDSPALKLKMQIVDMKAVLQSWVNPFAVVARDRRVTLQAESLFEGSALVSIDPVKFPWVISNLLSNAVRVSPPEGTISVRLSKAVNKVIMEITDQGPGVPEGERKKIFDAFFQASPPHHETGYLGLGLTIAREVVEAHGGFIEYLPNAPTGAIFRVSLPEVKALHGELKS